MYDEDEPDAHILPTPMELRGGAATLDRRLDRVPHYDDRSKDYPIRAVLREAGIRQPRSYSWAYAQLDQGQEGACTGFAVTMEAAARPVPVFGDPARYDLDEIALGSVAREVYYRARELDEWPGEAYEGSSALAAVKAGVERGWYSEYRWALGPGPEAAAEDVILSLGYLGPVVMGTNWYEDMYEAVGEDEFLDVSGRATGGHAYLLTRYSRKLDAVWTPNSWGGAGQGWIRRGDLVKLLAEHGEAVIPVKRTRPSA